MIYWMPGDKKPADEIDYRPSAFDVMMAFFERKISNWTSRSLSSEPPDSVAPNSSQAIEPPTK